MRVKILSGNDAGAIVDVGPEGAMLISNAFAELAPLEVDERTPPVVEPEPSVVDATDDPPADAPPAADPPAAAPPAAEPTKKKKPAKPAAPRRKRR